MDKIRLSSSKMDGYKWCPRKYKLQYIEKIPSGVYMPALYLGSALHKKIEYFWNNFQLDLDTYKYDINDFVKQMMKNYYIKDPSVLAQFRIYYANFINFQIRRIENYINIHQDDEGTINRLFFPILNEKRGKIAISSNIDFGFVVDALFYNHDGNPLIDWKSDKECNISKFKEHIPQLNRYTECLSRIGYSNSTIGIFFLKESLYFSQPKTIDYSLEKEVLNFVKMLQTSKFPKLPKSEKRKCHSGDWECEYYPEICNGV